MTKFVYISENFRNAWRRYVGIWEWEENIRQSYFDDDFKEEFKFKLDEEEHHLKENSRPPSWYLNDKLGEDSFVFNMSTFDYPVIPYEYTNNLPSFEDILMERAIEMRDTNKQIDLLYSGGIDSTAILYALYEVCPPDQIHIIMGDESPINYYPEGYKKVVRYLPFEFAHGNLFGMARLDTNLFTTGCEADRLFGGTGYPHSRYTNTQRYVSSEDDYEYNHKHWWHITRYTLLTQSWRLLQNISSKKIDVGNYQPFFLSPKIEQFAINQHYDRKISWHSNFWSSEENFLKTKMAIRDFIAKWDKDYAYSMGKTNMKPSVQKEHMIPLELDFKVVAITEDGTVVSRHNIMDYMKREVLTI